MSRMILLIPAMVLFGCEEQVQHGLDEKQANEIVSALHERGLPAAKVAEGGRKALYAISVDADDAKDALRILAELGLPRPKPEGFQELFAGAGLVPSASEERVRFLAALGGELSRTLESVDGVVEARVHLTVPTPAKFGQAVSPAKASAFVKVTSASATRIRAQREELAGLIAGAVEGLSVDQVSVVVSEAPAAKVTPRPPRADNNQRLRYLSAGLSFLVSLLAVAAGMLFLKLRQQERARTLRSPAVSQTSPTLKKAA